jgi:acyl carrier protein
MTEAEVRERLRGWIYDRAKDKPEQLDDSTPILETGILSSLDIVDMVLLIESVRGSEVEAESLEPSAFQDIDAIWKAFFAPS